MDRREFLAFAAAAAASPIRATVETPLRVGLIGSGWYGMVNARNLLFATAGNAKVEFVGIADPNELHRTRAAEEIAGKQSSKQRPETFRLHGDMLAKVKPNVVIVGSPDHWHALHTIDAVNAGADVYCEKPTCHSIGEGQAMVAAAAKAKAVVQIGTQRRSTPHVVRAKKFIESGGLGKVGVVKACCYYHMRNRGTQPNANPPATLDYDLWTGPAPLRPFNPIVASRGWRAFNEYGNGIVGDMFVHMLDTARFLLGFGWPTRVSSSGGIFVDKKSNANITDTQTVTLDYPDLTVTWEHRTYGPPDDPKYPWAVFLYGEKGVVKLDVFKWEFVPHGGGKAISEQADQDPKRADKDQDASITPGGIGHMANFLDCVASRKAPVANLAEGHISTTACLLGTIALNVGRTLQWDAKSETIVGDEPATKLMRRDYRGPWHYPTA
jgi:predicted dehydrogenase